MIDRKDLAARVSRPTAQPNQIDAVLDELRAAKIEEKEAEKMFGTPSRTMHLRARSLALPDVDRPKPPAKRRINLPSRPVLAANPVVINPDAGDQNFVIGRGRSLYVLNHMNEWLIATAYQLAMRCSKQPDGSIPDDDQIASLAESIRKNNLEKMSKGTYPFITKVPEAPSRTAWRPSAFGTSFANYRMPMDNENDAQRLNRNYEVTDVLTLSSIAAQLSVLSAKGYWGEENSALEPALPVFSRYRIEASRTQTYTSKNEARKAQLKSIDRWARIPEHKGGLPTVGKDWTLGDMDDNMFSRVHKAFLNPIPGDQGADDALPDDSVWVASLFETHTDNGQPEGFIDGVIAGPWITERDAETNEVYYSSGFSAIISEKWGQTNEHMIYLLDAVFHTPIGYRNLYIFVTHNTIGEQIKKVWKSILGTPDAEGKFPKGKYIDKKYADWLHIVYYEPLNSGKEEYAPEKAPAASLGEKKNHGAG